MKRLPRCGLRICCIILLPAVVYFGCFRTVPQAWENAARNSSRIGLRVIWEALVKYRNDHGEFPRGIDSAIPQDEAGLSWCVYLLPYLDEGELFRKFHLDENWNSEHNQKLLTAKPVFYESPIKGGDRTTTTSYLAVVSSVRQQHRSHDDDQKPRDIIIQADQEMAVPWTKPYALQLDSQDSASRMMGRHQGSFFVLLRDGSIEFRAGGGT